MEELKKKLDLIRARLSDEDFLSNKGLGNEVGIHVFCYNPGYEQAVAYSVQQLKAGKNDVFRIVEFDLYKIFLGICEEKRILKNIPVTEQRKGGAYLLEQLQAVASPAAFAEKMKIAPRHGDVVFITGVGKVYPYMRAHNILDNIQPYFQETPVVLFYPGTFNGHDMKLFGEFRDGNYYRAFSLI